MRRRRDFVEHGMVGRRFSGNGPTLVWIHGLGESGVCFERVLEEAGLESLPSVVPDLPGYGRSPWPIRPEGLIDTVEHLAQWMQRRIPVPAVVIGHSMGGVIGTVLAERYPDLVTGLVNIDGNVSIGDCAYSGRAVADEEDDFVAGGFDRLRDAIRRDGGGDLALAGYWASLRLADPATFHRHSVGLVGMSRSEDLAARLTGLGCLTLYIAGMPGGACRRSFELLQDAGAEVALVEPAGHWPFIDRPDEVASIIRRFIDRVGGDPDD